MERSQRKIHQKDELLTWPAHILMCSLHVLSHVLALNVTSLLVMTCPRKNQAGVAILVSLQECVVFDLKPHTGKPTLESHRSNIKFAFHFIGRKNNIYNSKMASKTRVLGVNLKFHLQSESYRSILAIMHFNDTY